jgi:primosomal protein N' (replication factor Y)
MSFNLKKIDEVKEQSIFQKEFFDSLVEVSKYFVTKKNLIISSLIPSVMTEEYDQISKATKSYKKNKLENKIVSQNAQNTQNSSNNQNIKKEKLLFQTSLTDRISYYKTLIRGTFAEKKSVFVILPTEKDIEIFQENLSKGIEKFTFSIHGNLSKNKQLETIEKILNSDHPVLILGTAPFLSIPRDDFKIIILEHESSNAYKTIKRPIIDLRIFAEIFAFKTNAKFILADTLLRFETIARKETEGLGEVYPLTYRVNFDGEIAIFGKNEAVEKITETEIDKKKFRILTNTTVLEIQKALEKKENIFIFALRKGLATTTVCNDCAELVLCDKCSAPVVLYQTKNKTRIFICNKCGTEKKSEITCTKCGSWNLVPLGLGTDTVFEEVRRLFPKTEAFKLDKETTKTAKKAENIIKDFTKSSGAILVGTEMALHYLKNKLPLTVIAAFDSLWSIPNFRMSEKIIHIIISVLSKTEKKLIIETKNEQDEIINAVKIDNLVSFVREEIRDRKNLGYPPFKRFIKISYLGNKLETASTRKFLAENFKEYEPEIFSGFVAKLKDKFITNCLIKINPENWSLIELTHNSKIDENLAQKLSSLPFQFSISIDPEDVT